MMMTGQKQKVAVCALVGGIGMGLAAVFLVASAARAQAADEPDDAEARAVIDKAIKAHGGVDKLRQFKAVSAKWAGKHKVEMPDKIRYDFEVENPNGGKFAFFRVVNGKRGWQGSARGTRDLKESEVIQIVDEAYAHWLASVVPLKDKDFGFSVVGDDTVEGKGAVGVRVSCKGRPDVAVLRKEKRPGDQE